MAKRDSTTDLRIKRTQNAIRESFFNLVEEKGFDHISVKDITDRAMISRNTFYLHYEDKYDLLNVICHELMRDLFFKAGKQLRRVQRSELTVESVASIIIKSLNAVDDNKKAYAILFSSSGTDVLNDMLAYISNRFVDLFNDDIDGIDDFSRQYIVSGITGIIKYYALNDVDDIEQKCYALTNIHLGKIIDIANSKKGK